MILYQISEKFYKSTDILTEVYLIDYLSPKYGFTDFQSGNPYGDYAIFDMSFAVKGTDSMFNLIGYDEDCGLMQAETVSGEPMVYGGYYMTSAAARLCRQCAPDQRALPGPCTRR